MLGHYIYTYDDREYIVAEHAEEAREMDPYGRERYTPYAPKKQGENCDHGKNKALSYRLLTTDSAFTYDDAGKLLTATEAEAGCNAMTVWMYSYDLMGNLSEKAQYKAENFTEISKMDAVFREDSKIQMCRAHLPLLTQLFDFVVTMSGEIKCSLRSHLISC